MRIYKDFDLITCYSCNAEFCVGTLRDADGFCPKCSVEIDLTEEPYA